MYVGHEVSKIGEAMPRKHQYSVIFDPVIREWEAESWDPEKGKIYSIKITDKSTDASMVFGKSELKQILRQINNFEKDYK